MQYYTLRLKQVDGEPLTQKEKKKKTFIIHIIQPNMFIVSRLPNNV